MWVVLLLDNVCYNIAIQWKPKVLKYNGEKRHTSHAIYQLIKLILSVRTLSITFHKLWLTILFNASLSFEHKKKHKPAGLPSNRPKTLTFLSKRKTMAQWRIRIKLTNCKLLKMLDNAEYIVSNESQCE